MSTDRDTTRIVRSWLEEGATALPDRVLDAVLDQVPATPQRRSWRTAGRHTAMNNTLKIALSAAAVVVVAVVGFNLLPRSSGAGGVATSPSAAAPSAAAPSIAPALGRMDPGRYRIADKGRTPVPFTFTVPAGWTGRADGVVFKNADQPDELGFSASVVTHVYADACNSEGSLTKIGTTVDDLVRALVDQADSEASTPVDATLGGRPAKRIDVSIPAGLDLATCRHPGELIQIWADPKETDYFAIPAKPGNHVSQVYVADVNGDRVVIVSGYPKAASASDIAELQAIVDSITFEP